MRSIDTNILLYSLNTQCEEHAIARRTMEELFAADDVVICELVLVELYMLLRNRAVVERPLNADDAATICTSYRKHPSWLVAESAPVMESVWPLARGSAFPRRRIIDARLAFTAQHHGVTEWITRNVSDFEDFGFERLTDPFGSM